MPAEPLPRPEAFASAALGTIRAIAAGAQNDRDRMLRLAAQVYATACYLQRHHANNEMDRAAVARLGDVRFAFERLRALPERPNVTQLYEALLTILTALDGQFPIAATGDWIEEETAVTAVAGLGGTVKHWVRHRPWWASRVAPHLRNAVETGRGPRQHARPPVYVLRNLYMHWSGNGDLAFERVDPAGAIGPRSAKQLDLQIQNALEAGHFRVALCPLPAWLRVPMEIHGITFAAPPETKVSPPAIAEYLDQLFDDAARTGIHLLVMPELCIDLALRDRLQERLAKAPPPSLLGIVAGSFHVWRDGAERPRNESALLARRSALFTHEKRGLFRLTYEQLQKMDAGWFGELARPLPAEIVEGIEKGSLLRVLESPLGRIAIAICADALDKGGDVGDHMQTRILRARPDLLFVVAMSPETAPFEQWAEALWDHQIATLFVNAACVCQPGSGAALAFAFLPLLDDRKRPPSRVRLPVPSGAGEPEEPELRLQWFDIRARSWRSWHERPADRKATSEVPWLALPDGRGLVVDLGMLAPSEEDLHKEGVEQ